MCANSKIKSNTVLQNIIIIFILLVYYQYEYYYHKGRDSSYSPPCTIDMHYNRNYLALLIK